MKQRKIKALDLERSIEEGQRFQLIDVRSPQEYASGHIPCAINLPMEQIENRLADMHSRDAVVLICESGGRAEMTSELLDRHRNDWILLDGGTSAWRESGLPVVGSSASRLPIMRQVQLVAGPLILIGAILALTVDVKWAFLSAFIGAGLTFAGATGFCGMALLLGKLPWNQPKSPPSAHATTLISEGK